VESLCSEQLLYMINLMQFTSALMVSIIVSFEPRISVVVQVSNIYGISSYLSCIVVQVHRRNDGTEKKEKLRNQIVISNFLFQLGNLRSGII
jgi:hypothetical protein